ncbi:MAG TPA: single-stranded-DNA-specific exonuclease RecJ, partial [Devosia sp.]|nr:single-stranded-DNA-specific exonuclease RecJ [Devosia sp.]
MSFEEPKFFLNVARSVSGNAWTDRLDMVAQRQATAIAQQVDVSEIVARILAARGVMAQNALSHLTPTIRELMPDPSVMTDMDAFASRLSRAIL